MYELGELAWNADLGGCATLKKMVKNYQNKERTVRVRELITTSMLSFKYNQKYKTL